MEWLAALLMSWQRSAADLETVAELTRLDHLRAEAYAANDSSMLNQVYVLGSAARQVDAATIRSYRARGARVVGAELKILRWRVVDRSEHTVTMRIVDQLSPSEVEWDDGSRVELPHDQPTRRAITLELTDDGWRIR